MILGETDATATRWLSYHDNDSSGQLLKFKIRFYSPKKFDELQKKFTTDNKGEEEIDIMGWREALIDWLVLDWDNIEKTKGKVAECNKENKILLMNSRPDIAEFLFDAARIPATFRCDADDFKKKYVLSLGIQKTIEIDGIDEAAMPA